MASARYNCPGALLTIGVNLRDGDRDPLVEESDGENTKRAQTRHNAMNTHANKPTAIRTTNMVHQACIVNCYSLQTVSSCSNVMSFFKLRISSFSVG